jgi:hypothetical protein
VTPVLAVKEAGAGSKQVRKKMRLRMLGSALVRRMTMKPARTWRRNCARPWRSRTNTRWENKSGGWTLRGPKGMGTNTTQLGSLRPPADWFFSARTHQKWVE